MQLNTSRELAVIDFIYKLTNWNFKEVALLTGCSRSPDGLASAGLDGTCRGGVRIPAATRVFMSAPVPGVDKAELVLWRVGLASGLAGAGPRTERPRGNGAGGRG